MTSLKVPDGGLVLASSPDPEFPAPPPPQAFIISLSDHVLDDMIKCVQSGEDLQLSLGNSPALLYGTSSHTLSPLSEPFSSDLFLTKPFESTKRATRLPQTSSLWKKLPGSEAPKKAERAKAKGAPSTSSSGMDSDIENLQNSIAAATASKKQSQVLDRLPPANKKVTGKAKSKLLSSMASYGNGGGKSSPSSPALVAVSSPSTNPVFSASQQVVEKFKEQRSMIVHELAVQDRPYDYLESLWEGKEEDFKPALEKVAQFEDTQKWALRKNYWRELDVWKYDYDTQDTRQKAIDNAIRQFDKMRLATTEPEWQKLLPREERGKGKILSKLQANIAKASSAAPPPKIKVQKADDAISDADEDVLKKKGGENMSRSSSNPLPPKPKKAADTTAKRLLSTNKKAAPAKAAQSKAKASATGKNGRVLSAEFVTNSDSDSESSEDKPMASIVAAKPRPIPAAAPAPKPKKPDTSLPRKPKIAVPKPRAKPAERPAERSTDRTVERSTERPKERSVEREAVKTVKAHPLPKRPRDETEDSSSSSGAPLAKRAKPKAPIKAPVNLKQRPADVSHASPRNSSGVSLKSKNTSPAKSSPLASSPPTNASDLEQPAPPKKRKAMESSDSSSVDSARAKSAPKRQRMLSPDLVNKAAKFKTYYEKYEALHWEIAEMQHPPEEKMASLLNMRERLKVLKTEIYRECPPAIAVA